MKKALGRITFTVFNIILIIFLNLFLSPSCTSSWSKWINLDEAIKRSRCCLLQIYYKPPIILSGAPKYCSVIDWSFKTLLKGRIPTIVLSGAASMSNKLLCSWLKSFRLFSCRWFLQYLLTVSATQFQNITTSFQTIPVRTLINWFELFWKLKGYKDVD